MKRAVLLFALLPLSACLGENPDPLDPQGRSAAELRAQKAACEADGGTFAHGGLSGLMCIRTLEDAGKACTRSTDCIGECVVNDSGRGQCYGQSPMFGCHVMLDEKGDKFEMCID
ncbi:hypothetical protein [Rhodovulum adriaticum]|uniref:Lipoprotein n=1 Tax=Rhodovulum adriaticum TaxID=35804 RepID=A0A4R2NYU6_RHOAD|nr:hypothetical protein [Rhodovulum adriaticum]MBK1634939.1 hypothetical protein [Rhodovulum adriaticum]TCP27410.1 hypothetical protein EV656_101316 [Rhodovulum adriaticum]